MRLFNGLDRNSNQSINEFKAPKAKPLSFKGDFCDDEEEKDLLSCCFGGKKAAFEVMTSEVSVTIAGSAKSTVWRKLSNADLVNSAINRSGKGVEAECGGIRTESTSHKSIPPLPGDGNVNKTDISSIFIITFLAVFSPLFSLKHVSSETEFFVNFLSLKLLPFSVLVHMISQ